MAYSAEIIKKVKEDFDKKRKAAQELATQRKIELHEKLPDVKIIDTVLSTTGLRVFSAAMSGNDTNAEIEKMRTESKALREMRAAQLEKAGYPADYSDVKYECPICSDTGYVDIVPCECFKKALVKESFLTAGLGSVLKDQTFDNFDLRFYSDQVSPNGKCPRTVMSHILSETKKYANGFKNAEKKQNLIFYGTTGLGKTHISTAIAARVLEDGMDVVYDTTQNIIHSFEAKTFAGDSAVNTSKYFDCDLLIIDDLGAEFKNSFTVSVLYNIINTRICAGKAMIISTNIDSIEGIAKAYDARIASRLVGEFRTFIFAGEDVRMIKRRKEKAK